MLLPHTETTRPAKRKRPQPASAEQPESPFGFRPGRNPAILGGAILVFITLGTLLTSQLQTPRATPTLQQDPVARALREVAVLQVALQRFQEDTGGYPTATEGLKALVQDPGLPGWSGHYVNLIQPDPWKTPYRYTPPPDGPEVRSAGPDRNFDTADDISPNLQPANLGHDTPGRALPDTSPPAGTHPTDVTEQ